MPPAGGPISTSPIASEDIYLQLHLKAAIEALWSHSKGNWEELMGCLKAELSEVAVKTPGLVYAAKVTANELTELRLKDLIKIYGGPDSMPKKKAGGKEKPEKSQYVTALVGILRARNENDFGRVVKVLESELSRKIGKKGFGI